MQLSTNRDRDHENLDHHYHEDEDGGGWRTEDGGRRTDDGGQTTEDRRRTTDDDDDDDDDRQGEWSRRGLLLHSDSQTSRRDIRKTSLVAPWSLGGIAQKPARRGILDGGWERGGVTTRPDLPSRAAAGSFIDRPPNSSRFQALTARWSRLLGIHCRNMEVPEPQTSRDNHEH